jgi:high-affinity iron transporter
VLTTFVIGLREGLEAALIVGIIAAFITRRGDRSALGPMWWGVAAAVTLSAGGAIALHVANRSLTLQSRELMEGVLALVAVAGITYMIVWMRKHSTELKSDLEAKAHSALAVGSVAAIAGMAFVAVLREGLETAVFVLATLENSASPVPGAVGVVGGILTSVVLGYAIYSGGIRIDLGRFFRVTGIILVVVAAGLLASAVHSFSEAGVVGFLQGPAVDLSWLIAPGTVRSSLLTAFVGLQPVPTAAEMLAWALFLVPMTFFVSGMRFIHPKQQMAV